MVHASTIEIIWEPQVSSTPLPFSSPNSLSPRHSPPIFPIVLSYSVLSQSPFLPLSSSLILSPILPYSPLFSPLFSLPFPFFLFLVLSSLLLIDFLLPSVINLRSRGRRPFLFRNKKNAWTICHLIQNHLYALTWHVSPASLALNYRRE